MTALEREMLDAAIAWAKASEAYGCALRDRMEHDTTTTAQALESFSIAEDVADDAMRSAAIKLAKEAL